jgi:hypothetical protein
MCVCGAEWTWQEIVELGWALGPVKHLRELLANGTLDANWKNEEEDDTTLLMSAAGAGLLANTTALMEAGADISARNYQGGVINYAFGVESGTYTEEIVVLLLEHKASVEKNDPWLWLEGSGAGGVQAPTTFKRLLQLCHMEPTDTRDHLGQQQGFVELAVRRGRHHLLSGLLEQGVPVAPQSPFLYIMSSLRDKALFDKVLAASGVSANEAPCADGTKKTLVQVCLERQSHGGAEFIIHLVTNHDAKTSFAELAKPPGQFWAIDHLVMPLAVFDALVKRGQDPWAAKSGVEGWLLEMIFKAMEYAMSQSSWRRSTYENHVKAMLDRMASNWSPSADLFAKTERGAMSLSQAARCASWELVRHLIAAGSGLEAEYKDPSAVAAMAVPPKWPPVPLQFRSQAAQNQSQANSTAPEGASPLVSATRAGNSEIVELLLNSKADLVAGHRRNVTSLAHQHLSRELADRLKQCTDDALEERARKLALSGDGSIDNVGIKLDGQVVCTECRQRFDSEDARKIHWRFIHDPNRHQED